MDLNNIKLNEKLLTDLYPNTLIQTYATVMPEKEGILYTGRNKKNILIVIYMPGGSVLKDYDLVFLESILAACKLNIDDVAIHQLAFSENITYKRLIQHFKSKIVLLFNVDPRMFGLPISFPFYQVQNFDSVTYLYAPGLEVLQKDKIQKKELWTSLRQIFYL